MIEFRWHADNPDTVQVLEDGHPILDVDWADFDEAWALLREERPDL